MGGIEYTDNGYAAFVKRILLLVLLIVLLLTACTLSTLTDEVLAGSQAVAVHENQLINDDILLDGLTILHKSTILTSFIIAENDTIILEKYYNGSDQNQSTNVQSVTKSVISALMGIAIREGYIKGADQELSEFLPSVFSTRR